MERKYSKQELIDYLEEHMADYADAISRFEEYRAASDKLGYQEEQYNKNIKIYRTWMEKAGEIRDILVESLAGETDGHN